MSEFLLLMLPVFDFLVFKILKNPLFGAGGDETSMDRETYKERPNPKQETDTPCVDDSSAGGSKGLGVSDTLRKGPWTLAEDAILVEYVTKHGVGNWNAVGKRSGLFRCGKSCRFRWANYLRPDLKKSGFSPEEKRRIVELHAEMGNKWSRMAAELPGHTDNEIKHYWNARIKRLQRAGLPIYPPDICLRALSQNQKNEQIIPFSLNSLPDLSFLPTDNIKFHALDFKATKLDQLLCPPELNSPNTSLDVPTSSLQMQGFNSFYSNNFSHSTIYESKCLGRSNSLFHRSYATVGKTPPELNQYQSYDLIPISESFEVLPANYPYSAIDYASSSDALSGSHAIINDNVCSFKPILASKPELPSLQNHMGCWGSSSSPLPSRDPIDMLFQTPFEHAYWCSLSPQNSGLLDAVPYQSLRMKKKNMFHQTSHDETSSEPFCPFCRSSSSVFSKGTPISGSTCDQPRSLETSSVSVKDEASGDLVALNFDETTETTNLKLFPQPDLC